MITSNQGLEDSLKYLIQESDTFNRRIDNNMDSKTFNNILKDIESHINHLYEKTRVMEDVKNYIKTFVVKTIDERRNKIINKLKVIEMSADKNKGTKSITEVINFNNYSQYILDRDGEQIDILDNINGKLVLPSKLINEERLTGIVNKGQNEISQTEQFNESTLESIDNNPLASIYESYTPAINGMVNDYEITFGSRADCNKIEFNPINCEVIYIKVTTFDGKEIKLDNNQTYLEEPIDIEKMDIKVRCNNYDTETISYVDNITNDAFDNSFIGV